jgi:hypothetical protein
MAGLGKHPHPGRAAAPIGVGTGSLLVGIWVNFAVPYLNCSGPFACTAVGVGPLYPLAYLLIVVGIGLVAFGALGLVRWSLLNRRVVRLEVSDRTG